MVVMFWTLFFVGINIFIDHVSVQAKHTQDNGVCWGVDGETGCLSDMSTLGIWEPLAVKAQTYKTAVEVRGHLITDQYTL